MLGKEKNIVTDDTSFNDILINNNAGTTLNNTENSNIEVNIKPSTQYTLPTKYEVVKNENGTVTVGNAKITNNSKMELDLNELSIPSTFKISSENKFLIYHTHATESYTIPENPNIENYRTTDINCSVVCVGSTLIDELKSRNFNCVHDITLHDYPSYNGAYSNSLKTIQSYLNNEKFDFVIDIHRDALSSNLNFRPTVEINGEKAAQLMFVIGSNSNNLGHEKWMENLKLALMIQNRANEMYPGLFRNLNLSSSRYNQQVSTGAFIIEVGATGNTLQDAKNSMKYLAEVFNSFK